LKPKSGNKGYINGHGDYQCGNENYISSKDDVLLADEKESAGLKLLVNNVALVTLKVFEKETSSSTTLGIDFVAVAPLHGQRILKRSTQINISPKIIEAGAGYKGS